MVSRFRQVSLCNSIDRPVNIAASENPVELVRTDILFPNHSFENFKLNDVK